MRSTADTPSAKPAPATTATSQGSAPRGRPATRPARKAAAKPTCGAAELTGADLLATAAARLAAALAAPGLAAPDLALLLPLAERLGAETARRSFLAALSRLQAELPAIVERGEIRDPDGRGLGAYALWEDCVAALREPLARHGFALSFRTETGSAALTVAARLSHLAGHVEETSLVLPFDASGWIRCRRSAQPPPMASATPPRRF